jgi:hypothetical protein
LYQRDHETRSQMSILERPADKGVVR